MHEPLNGTELNNTPYIAPYSPLLIEKKIKLQGTDINRFELTSEWVEL